MESDPTFDPKVWDRLGSELGVLGLSVPEADGGVGGSLVDQAVAVEEFGAALACGPLFGTVFLAIPALVACPAGPARDELLAELVEGTRTAAFAVPDAAGAFDPAAVTVTAAGQHRDRDRRCGWSTPAPPTNCWSPPVGPDGLGLYAVDAGSAGVTRTPLVTLDLTRPQATVGFADAPARLVAGPDEAERVITTRCRSVRRCWPSSRSAPRSICWTSPSTTPSPGCSSVGRSGRSRRSSIGWPTCSSTSSTPARPRITRCGR